MRRWVRWAGRVAAAGALLWLAGFALFVAASRSVPAPPPELGAIVVLTGAPGRIEAGLRLLADRPGARLLISGVGHAVGFGELARRAGGDPGLASRVTLGRLAHTTSGNAREAADWARQTGVATLIVVTSPYHMQRALLEFARAMPDVVLVPAPVPGPWPHDSAGWRLYAGEFNKYLAVLCHLGVLADRDDPAI
jgi:uncharacterized SAM-binding protein YcdF (DUF218 family)